MGDDDKNKPKEDEGLLKPGQSNFEESHKRSYEDKQWERGVGNRTPQKPPEGEHKFEFNVGPVYKRESNFKPALYDSTKGANADQVSFIRVLQMKAGDLEFGSAAVNIYEAKAKAVLAKAKLEASVVHAEVDLVDKLGKLLFGDKKPAPPPPPPEITPAPMAARVGDPTAHATLLVGIGSTNVYIGGQPAWRATMDMHLCTAPGAAPHGLGIALPGAAKVLINGMPAARAGDAIAEPTGGPNMIMVGCPTVMIGPKAPPPAPAPPPQPAAPKELPWVKFESVAKGDVLAAEGDLQAYAEMDVPNNKGIAEVQAGGMVAVMKGELPLKVRFHIPTTEYYLGLGLTAEGSLLSAGAEAGAGIKINEPGEKLVSVTAGAKVGAGLGGVGVKFGVDIAK